MIVFEVEVLQSGYVNTYSFHVNTMRQKVLSIMSGEEPGKQWKAKPSTFEYHNATSNPLPHNIYSNANSIVTAMKRGNKLSTYIH